jgi:hypothetical protein
VDKLISNEDFRWLLKQMNLCYHGNLDEMADRLNTWPDSDNFVRPGEPWTADDVRAAMKGGEG